MELICKEILRMMNNQNIENERKYKFSPISRNDPQTPSYNSFTTPISK